MRANPGGSDPIIERVILVDLEDRERGVGEKMETHRRGWLHRAFSIFVFNSRGELLLQRRAPGKYHSSGLWTNTCCGHPRPGESTAEAARRRLREEMGFECGLEEQFSFTYRADLPGGLVEHEHDHVYCGLYDGDPRPDLSEASDWRWAAIPAIEQELRADQGRYTHWFGLAFPRVVDLR